MCRSGIRVGVANEPYLHTWSPIPFRFSVLGILAAIAYPEYHSSISALSVFIPAKQLIDIDWALGDLTKQFNHEVISGTSGYLSPWDEIVSVEFQTKLRVEVGKQGDHEISYLNDNYLLSLSIDVLMGSSQLKTRYQSINVVLWIEEPLLLHGRAKRQVHASGFPINSQSSIS